MYFFKIINNYMQNNNNRNITGVNNSEPTKRPNKLNAVHVQDTVFENKKHTKK